MNIDRKIFHIDLKMANIGLKMTNKTHLMTHSLIKSCKLTSLPFKNFFFIVCHLIRVEFGDGESVGNVVSKFLPTSQPQDFMHQDNVTGGTTAAHCHTGHCHINQVHGRHGVD